MFYGSTWAFHDVHWCTCVSLTYMFSTQVEMLKHYVIYCLQRFHTRAEVPEHQWLQFTKLPARCYLKVSVHCLTFTENTDRSHKVYCALHHFLWTRSMELFKDFMNRVVQYEHPFKDDQNESTIQWSFNVDSIVYFKTCCRTQILNAWLLQDEEECLNVMIYSARRQRWGPSWRF